MTSKTIRMVTRETDGELRIRDYAGFDDILKVHEQVGIEDSSTDLTLRGLPVFRGLIGPMPDGRTVARYESPEVFEVLTKEWASQKTPRRRRRQRSDVAGETQVAVLFAGETSDTDLDLDLDTADPADF
jgi:hypothetical protein